MGDEYYDVIERSTHNDVVKGEVLFGPHTLESDVLTFKNPDNIVEALTSALRGEMESIRNMGILTYKQFYNYNPSRGRVCGLWKLV